ncbi:MAG TPA: DUF3667 domain-containing protein [Sphingomicrobium sp.]|nr:DUF3667 domain-containing protein [Sphingomicrobium sp.]
MAEFEAVGDALTGGILARTIEQDAGKPGGDRPSEAVDCLNCGTSIQGDFCGACGQKRNVHRTITAIAHELIHGVLHLDGKLWRTLPLLAWRPGELTRRYVHGERARFVSPFSMFLFSIFLMFAVLQVGGESPIEVNMASPVQMRRDLDLLRNEMATQLRGVRSDRIKVARGKRVRHLGKPQSIESIDQRIAQLQMEIGKLDEIRTQASHLRFGEYRPNVQVDLFGPALVIEEFERNPGLALYKLQSNSYKFSWLLIPISVPFVWLLFFWTRRYRFYDHMVFVTYSMAFMSLLAIVLTIMGLAGVHVAIIATAGCLIPPVHLYRQIREAYWLGRSGALVRTALLAMFCLVIATGYLALLLIAIG